MKLNNFAKTVVFGLAVLLASSAFASNKGVLQASEPFQVNGQQLAAGTYQLRWDGAGSDVEVSFLKNNKELAKAPAKVVVLTTAPADGYYTVQDLASGHTITEVGFAGKKYALSIGAPEKTEMSKAASN